MPVALQVTQLSKVFRVGFFRKRVVALDRVSFEVEKGEIFGLLGPNGAGKTTAIKSILSLIHPDSGTIQLFGKDVQAAKDKIGFLTENPYVYDFLTGREYLTFFGKLHGLDTTAARRKADELISFFRLESASNTILRKYSKGMLQRIGLAQALVNDPEFLILDEPMSGLDPVGRKEVRDLLLSLKNRGCTLLFSSHILADAEMICDRVAILVTGKMQTSGRLDELLRKIQSYEVTLTNLGDTTFDGISHELITSSDSQCLLRVPSVKEIDELIALSKVRNFQIESIVPQRQTLEELYLKQIK